MLAVYAGASWVVLEVADVLIDRLALPAWIYGLAVILLLVGLPIVLGTAFVQEGVTSGRGEVEASPTGAEEGPEATPGAPGARSLRRVFTWRNAIAGGVLAFALWGMAAAGWLLVAGPPPSSEVGSANRQRSIAVLPFENLNPDSENAYFAAGIHEDVLSQLSKIRDLAVISRTSVMLYQNSNKDIGTIAEELGAGAILEGSVRRAGESVRVVVQLIDPARDAHVWSETYDRRLTVSNVFEIQSEIAGHVARALDAELTDTERDRIEATPTQNREAYDFYLRGNSYVARSGFLRADYAGAQQMYEQAVRIDPEFALAHAKLSQVHGAYYHHGWDRTEDRLNRALTAARRALDLEPGLPEAHMALGGYYYYGFRDYERALLEFDLALDLWPRNDEALSFKATLKKRQGEFEEARELYRRVAKLSPRDPDPRSEIAITYLVERRYRQSEAYFDSALSLAPDYFFARLSKNRLPLWQDGRTAQVRSALAAIPSGMDPSGHVTYYRWLVEFFDREYGAALEALAVDDFHAYEDQQTYFPAALLEGFVHRASQDSVRALAAFDSARSILAARLGENPGDERLHTALALAYAGLGQAQAAEEHGRRAMELMPSSKDVLGGQGPLLAMVLVKAMLQQRDDAIRYLEEYLSRPGVFSIRGLARDPRLDGIRNHPRFQALLERQDQG